MQLFMIALLVAGVVSNRYLSNFWSPFNLFAVCLYLAGLAIFAWAGWFVEPYNRFHLPKNLATKGPYRFSRNPQTIATALMLFATALVSGSFVILGIATLLIIYLALIKVSTEERTLKEKFGSSYEDYYSKTRRWF